MNICAVSTTGLTATYKTIADNFSAADLNLLRNLLCFLVSCVWCAIARYNPLTRFPRDQKGVLAVRCLSG